MTEHANTLEVEPAGKPPGRGVPRQGGEPIEHERRIVHPAAQNGIARHGVVPIACEPVGDGSPNAAGPVDDDCVAGVC
jgi:hypothetical protein